MRSRGLQRRHAKIGCVGPYPLHMESFQSLVESNKVSDETIDALFHLFSMKSIFEHKREVVGPYLEHGNHWTFFHSNIVDRSITYLNSLGEQDEQYSKIEKNWSAYAASKGYLGPWKRMKREHTLQTDGISCGIFTAVFAEIFLEGKEEYLACPSVEQERERLGLLLFNSLDKSGICGICHQSVSVKNKGRCSSCFANIHTKCLPGSQEDSRSLCKEDKSGESHQNRGVETEDRSGKVTKTEELRQKTGQEKATNTEKSRQKTAQEKVTKTEELRRKTGQEKVTKIKIMQDKAKKIKEVKVGISGGKCSKSFRLSPSKEISGHFRRTTEEMLSTRELLCEHCGGLSAEGQRTKKKLKRS
ncbi:uncharacterized protein LOC125721161 isoform X3 [Brienomyrus brachyistius]|nr:uncharacterized protein LOC125721161 isoform X3 [Brienomyrus brachyistius]